MQAVGRESKDVLSLDEARVSGNTRRERYQIAVKFLQLPLKKFFVGREGR